MRDALSLFLHDLGRRPFSWGKTDCLMILADWWQVRTGSDPASGFRGSYRDERGARDVMRKRGGILKHVEGCLAAAGARRCSQPVRGDVGLVRAAVEMRSRLVFVPVGAICMGPRLWAIKDKTGLAAGDFQPIQAWTENGGDGRPHPADDTGC